MKTVTSDNENNENFNSNITDLLIDKERGQNELKCNADLVHSSNVLNIFQMGHKGQYYERIVASHAVTNDSRSQSLPNDLDESNVVMNGNNSDIVEDCDTKTKLLHHEDSPPSSPVQELWFKTWPERIKANDSTTNDGSLNLSNTRISNKNMTNSNPQKLSLNEALKNISLTYSPITKQLHLVECEKVDETPQKDDIIEEENANKKLGHRRNEPGSFSSTVSSLSDPSPSGSLLDYEDRSSPIGCDTGAKPKRKSFSHFFNRNVFNWKSGVVPTTPTISTASVWKLFSKTANNNPIAKSPQRENVVVSSAALIQHMRPSSLPAKTIEEEERHREEYKAILVAAKKKEALNSAAKQKQQKLQLQVEEQQAQSAKHFTSTVLANWESTHNTRKTRDLWWLGLPSSVRGKVWRLAIGNDLNLTQQLYDICLTRAQIRLNSTELSKCDTDGDPESSMDVIQLDISRTFPNLCIFQEGGPYSDVLHSLLAAYVCYRPDVGYVQGMSFIAAILILNMEHFHAFVCFANLLNRPLHIAAFTLNQIQMQAYFNAFNEIFNYNLPKLYAHFECAGLTPDLYLLDWIYTVYAKAMPLDVACRIWDVFLRDGDEFLFKTALGILHLNQDLLMTMDFLHGAQFLTRLPEDLPVDQLFKSIQFVSTNIGKQTFTHIVDRHSNSTICE